MQSKSNLNPSGRDLDPATMYPVMTRQIAAVRDAADAARNARTHEQVLASRYPTMTKGYPTIYQAAGGR